MWGVRVGDGALLTMEFGNPRLEVDEVRHAGVAHRAVRPRGEWQLSLQECAFDLQVGDFVVTDASDADELELGARRLDGQALLDVRDRAGVLVIEFDLGAVLEARPIPERSGPTWVLASRSALYASRAGRIVDN